ncbi:DUF1552 domain-containing protein [Pseudomonas sp. ITEM 17296]|jgi:hypothetical protein|uniref:DUF1552 domain-containing protein n=1 Tax=Pseudomonas sp. ITEM 17296 TaxID=2790281 RepID=UPI000C129069|nr:DUF1552 domain-containing protein [Pseudomonas sp. ITEM 17296]ATP48177.1 Tat pathway signal protein [Pseudomonas putida]MDE4538693.1 DUF1552 domain-containing protein [Pseudomonas sp. ITEM 17296]GLO59385.1 hypothetical protein PPUJ20066_54210 [Pseudomonas putida]
MDILKSRRRFLMQLAAAGTLLPLSSSGFAQFLLQGERQVPRLKVVFFIVPDGLAVDSYSGGYGDGLWFPRAVSDDSTNFELNAVSQELAAYRDQSLYLQGIIVASGQGGHGAWNYALRDNKGQMSSIDKILGDAMPGTQPTHRSLFAGPHAGIDNTPWYVSWDGDKIRAPQQNPVRLYESVFGATSRAVRDSQSRNAHVFDPIRADIAELRGRVAGAQREKLVTHLDALEQVAKDLEGAIPSVCEPLSLEDHPISSAQFRNEVQAGHHKVVAAALGCGVTRVATVQVGRSAESLNILDVSASTNPHDCAHRYAGEEVWRGSRQWYVRQVKLFMDELARYSDPDVPGDSLLKHTLVVFTSEMADGAPEHMMNMPMVLMGGASGLLRNGSGNGRYFSIKSQWDRELHSDAKLRFVDMQRIWSTIALAAGTSVPYAGNVSPVTGIFTNVT